MHSFYRVTMNIIKNENRFIVETKTSGSNDNRIRRIIYYFIESAYILCLDKVELMKPQIKACERMLKMPEEGKIKLS